MKSPCPMCGSNRHRKTDAQGSFQVLASRLCRDCGHIWEPASPRWLLKVGLVAGIGCFVFGALLILSDWMEWVGPPPRGVSRGLWSGLWFCGIGIMVFAGCWRRLRKRAAGMGAPAQTRVVAAPPPDPPQPG